MSVKKSTASTLRKKGLHYISISVDVARDIKQGDALMIWIYLLTQSEGWKVRAKHLMDYFDMGETRYYKATRYLRDKRLLRRVIVQDESGRFVDNELEIYSEPYDVDLVEDSRTCENHDNGENNNLQDTTEPLKTPISVKPELGKTGCLIKYQDNSLIKDKEGISADSFAPSSFQEKEEVQEGEDMDTTGGKICSELAKLGFAKCSPNLPSFKLLITKGVSVEDFIAVAEEVKARGITSFPYVVSTIKGRLEAGEAIRKTKSKKADIPVSASHQDFKKEPVRVLTKEEKEEAYNKLEEIKKKFRIK